MFQFDGVGLGYITISDFEFNLESAVGVRAVMHQSPENWQNLTFLRCDIRNMASGFHFQGEDTSGGFVVDCTLFDSDLLHIYAKCSRLALLDTTFEFSANHLAYLRSINTGVIAGNEFKFPAFGRHALRLSEGDNIYIARNLMEGWIDPRTASSPRYCSRTASSPASPSTTASRSHRGPRSWRNAPDRFS